MLSKGIVCFVQVDKFLKIQKNNTNIPFFHIFFKLFVIQTFLLMVNNNEPFGAVMFDERLKKSGIRIQQRTFNNEHRVLFKYDGQSL